jgi:hypothetical protein
MFMIRTGSAAFVLVCLLVPALPARADTAPVVATLHDWAKKAQGRYAYGTYIKDKKTGWIIEEMKLGKHAGKDVLVSLSESYNSTLFDGEKNVKEEKTVITYELTGDGAILHAEVKQKEDGKETIRTAVRHGKGLRITTKIGGRTLTRDIDMPKDTLAEQRRLEAWLKGTPKVGEKFTKYSVSWEEKEVDQKEIYNFKEKKTILWAGVKMKVCVVDVDVDRAILKSEVLEDSRLVTGELGGLLSIRLEKEAIAKKLDGGSVDLMSASSIFVDRDLGRARKVDSLVLEVTGLGDFQIPASHRQFVEPIKGKDAITLQVRRDHRIEKAAVLSKEQRVRYTRSSPRVQCDHEAIRDQAKAIVGDEKDPLKAAKKLEAWVYKTIRKSYSDNADTALQVLDHKAGDCTEHALLFVALARALGIPAREVGGVAYVSEPKPLFGWHAWAEIHDGHQWVSIDPTWNEVYVDGTHIKLSEGSRDMAWANVAGKMKVKVVKVEKRK